MSRDLTYLDRDNTVHVLRLDPTEPDWIAGGAACLGKADLFTQAEGKSKTARARRRQALALCATCPLLDACREWADREHFDSVVIGGEDHT